MRRTPWPRLVGIALLAGLVALAGLRIADALGYVARPVPLLAPLAVALIAAVVLGAGWNVRQYTRGKRPGLEPIVAARTVVLATAACYTGALLAGWYGAQVVSVLGDLAIAGRREIAVAAGIGLLASVALAVVGLVVERWCEVRPPDDEGESGRTPVVPA